MRGDRDFSLAGLLLLMTVLGFASWAISVPSIFGDPTAWPLEWVVRLLVVWELGIVPLDFLRWRKRRGAGVE